MIKLKLVRLLDPNIASHRYIMYPIYSLIYKQMILMSKTF